MLLKKKHLADFKDWLEAKGIAYRDGKGEYQVMQILTETDGWQVVFWRKSMQDYYTANDKLQPIIEAFYKEHPRD